MPSDSELIQIVDAAMAEAVRKSGAWIHCHIGCTECCMGSFPITVLDARRLAAGLADLESRDPQRAGRVLERARRLADRMDREYPRASLNAVLEGEALDDEPCPALDPDTGACDLYAARPVTCRTFGPAVRFGEGPPGICHLCYQGATDEEIAACQIDTDAEDLEGQLVREAGGGETIVALALLGREGFRS